MKKFIVYVKFTVEAKDEEEARDIIDTELTESAGSLTLAVLDPIISRVIEKVVKKSAKT